MHKKTKENQVVEIDLMKLLKLLWKRKWIIIVVTLLFGIAFYCYSRFMITPTYRAGILMYVNNNNLKEVSENTYNANYISAADISASIQLVNTYAAIIKSENFMKDVVAELGMDINPSALKGMTSIGAVNETEVFQVVVTSPDPQLSADIANAIAKVAPTAIGEIVEGSSAKVVDYATVPKGKSAPNNAKNAAMGAVIGLVLSAIIILIIGLADRRIKEVTDFESWDDIPLLGSIPDFDDLVRGKHIYGSEAKLVGKSKNVLREHTILSKKTPFAISEAYKSLRTNLDFSMSESVCKTVVITSANQGETKSTTSVNLAITIALAKQRVLLIEGDLRLPHVAKVLKLPAEPGLSNVLIGKSKIADAIYHLSNGLDVMPAGSVPPNPSELLGLAAMDELLAILKKKYDFVIIDSAPACAVTDAAILARKSDGVIFVVRRNAARTDHVNEGLNALNMAGAKIVGFVFTCANELKEAYKSRYSKRGYGYGYGRKGYGYGKYGYSYGQYGYGYGYGYDHAAKQAEEAAEAEAENPAEPENK